MAAARMTQAQLIRHLAGRCDVNNKVVRACLEELAKITLQETKKNGVFVLPGIGRLVKSNRKARMGRISVKYTDHGTGCFSVKTVGQFHPASSSKRARMGRKDLAASGEDAALKTLAEVFSVL